ncbi:TraR/DksA family transcriptional regulator [Antricoccus suffuscus]|uniref:TraR/DksA family transcriptional regulator n=1 Tax=Antricoccus suffuscus TaxID=1629062 RepID=A0A2T0Z5P2_9ACTN|nr:TraR/DksA C4-type zinc finger protein [Antricoccus suffuscus]PRZ31677.1 TraR/DksA family transcriptional regulator [Antricoccus suffuscus]
MAAKKSAGAKTASGARAAKKIPAKSVVAKKTAPTKTAPTKKTAAKSAAPVKVAVNGTAKKTAATKPAATAATAATKQTPKTAPKKTVPAKSAAKKTAPTKAAAKPKTPFNKVELREFGKLIDGQLQELQAEYDTAMIALDDLQHNRLDTAGDDPADAGNKTFEREQEMSIANNRMHLITQLQRARARVDEGSYGLCENCGKTIPKARLQAYPSATLCVDCKAREERR